MTAGFVPSAIVLLLAALHSQSPRSPGPVTFDGRAPNGLLPQQCHSEIARCQVARSMLGRGLAEIFPVMIHVAAGDLFWRA